MDRGGSLSAGEVKEQRYKVLIIADYELQIYRSHRRANQKWQVDLRSFGIPCSLLREKYLQARLVAGRSGW